MIEKKKPYKEKTDLISVEYPINVFINESRYTTISCHWHEHIEIVCLLKGQASIYVGDQIFEANPGDIVIVPSNEVHFGHSINNTKAKLINLVFHPSLLIKRENNQFREVISPYINNDYTFPKIIRSDKLGDTYLYDMLVSIHQEFEYKNRNFLIKAMCLLTLFFVELSRKFPPSIKEGKSTSLNKSNMIRLRRLFDYIESHYSDKITVDMAANIVGVTPNHFCKLFKQITGRTFVQFLNLYRVNKAEELIQNTDKPITEIAFDLGFCNVNYFDQVFKEYKGYIPSTIRKQQVEERKI